MTLIIGKQCSNGVLLIADSASIPQNGVATCGAIKSIQGMWAGEPYALVFGGYAGNVGGIQTLDTIISATAAGVGSIQDNIRDAVRNRLIDEVNHGNWQDVAERDQFAAEGHIFVFLSVRHYEWWLIDATAHQQHRFTWMQPGAMVISQISSNLPPHLQLQANNQLVGMCDNGPQTLLQASQSAAPLFHQASTSFQNEVRYPGQILFHQPAGVSTAAFANPAELLAAAALLAP